MAARPPGAAAIPIDASGLQFRSGIWPKRVGIEAHGTAVLPVQKGGSIDPPQPLDSAAIAGFVQ